MRSSETIFGKKVDDTEIQHAFEQVIAVAQNDRAACMALIKYLFAPNLPMKAIQDGLFYALHVDPTLQAFVNISYVSMLPAASLQSLLAMIIANKTVFRAICQAWENMNARGRTSA